jgi:hypothetical protein
VLADAGYRSNEHIDRLRERGITPLIAADADRSKVRPRPKAKSKLAETGKLTVSAHVGFTPTGGEPHTKPKKVRLKRRDR